MTTTKDKLPDPKPQDEAEEPKSKKKEAPVVLAFADTEESAGAETFTSPGNFGPFFFGSLEVQFEEGKEYTVPVELANHLRHDGFLPEKESKSKKGES